MKHVIIGTAGHVDHGKTALIKALTNFDCDTHKEEKERGITINLGFTHLDLPSGESVGIVDVPGHKDFIKTMVAGAYGIDIVLLVVAADSGIMPQTREHLQIIEMLGVQHGIIVLNKADLVDEEMIEFNQLEISEFVEGTKLENAPIVPVSSLSGNGIDLLIEEIEKIIPKVKEKEITDRFRMYIDRIFNVKGIGFVVTGSVLEGKISQGKDLYLLPGKAKKVKIRGLERHGSPTEEVFVGDRAAINLAGLKFEDYVRGMVLSNKQLEETEMIDATCTIFDETTVLGLWSNVIFYTGTFECNARMHLLDKDELSAGQTGIVQIHLGKPAVLVNKDKFIIRNTSNDLTYGGGTVIDVQPLHHKRRTEKVISELTELVDATLNSDKLINLVKIELGKTNIPEFASAIASKIHKTTDEVVAECEENQNKELLIFKSGDQVILLRNNRDAFYRKQVLEEINSYHQKNPILEEGLETIDFYGKFSFGSNEAGKIYLDHVMSSIYQEGLIKKAANTWALKEHEVKIDTKTQNQLNWLEQTILNVGMDKPMSSEIEEKAHQEKINKDRLKMMLKFLRKEGKLVFFEGEYIHSEIVNRSRKILLEKIATKADGINEKEFREMIEGTKKLVQMLLGIFLEEGSVIKPTFYILITEKGKNMLN
ncbi:MAG TPA: selenocysteine-specific translation elongation factor [Bacteroidales bacterium]|nr:selenocysteine-specific translation elongation factor [Bacteroidales bacterium]HRX95683.1 selenocysteine-specific translation elongation factor [Bacteroidales bacterium]